MKVAAGNATKPFKNKEIEAVGLRQARKKPSSIYEQARAQPFPRKDTNFNSVLKVGRMNSEMLKC
jgi:hypothetical protein